MFLWQPLAKWRSAKVYKGAKDRMDLHTPGKTIVPLFFLPSCLKEGVP